MKQILLGLIVLFSSTAFAQEVADSSKMAEQEIKEMVKEDRTAAKNVKDAEQALKDAEEEYKQAQKEVSDLRARKAQAENEMEQARAQLRRARLALTAERKRANPEVIERYEVIMHPIFEEMSLGTQSGLSVLMMGSESDGLGNLLSKNADGELKSYLKNYSSEKVKKRKGELFFDNINIPEMSATPMDVYARFDKQDEGVLMKLFFNNGTGFIDFQEENSTTDNGKNIFDNFARYMRQTYLEGKMKDEEKELRKLNKDLENYHKDVAKAREDIGKSEGKIAEAIGDISATESQIDQLNEQLERTRKLLSKVQ